MIKSFIFPNRYSSRIISLKVKPLEWEETRRGAICRNPFYYYYIYGGLDQHVKEEFSLYVDSHHQTASSELGVFKTIESAKFAALNHHANRIRELFEPEQNFRLEI